MQPTAEEITARKKMYKEVASLGIDLMGYDSNDSAIKRRNRRKAVVLLGTGQSVPEKLKKRLIKKDIPQSGKKKISVKKCGQIILLVLQGRVCRQECSIRLPSGMKDISQLPHRIQSIRSNRCSLLFVRRSAHWVEAIFMVCKINFKKWRESGSQDAESRSGNML